MLIFLVILQILLSIGLISLILMQHGKGADAGAAFGSGASATVFGARGSASFLTRTTAIMATLFFLTSVGLAHFSMQKPESHDLMQGVETQPKPSATTDIPAAPVEKSKSGSDLPAQPPEGSKAGSDIPAMPEQDDTDGKDVPSMPEEDSKADRHQPPMTEKARQDEKTLPRHSREGQGSKQGRHD